MNLFDTHNWMPRRMCGLWPEWLVQLNQVSDMAIALAYLMIGPALWTALRRDSDVIHYSRFIIFMFGLFIVFCGAGHAIDSQMFDTPAYGLASIVKVGTAATSWLTVFGLMVQGRPARDGS